MATKTRGTAVARAKKAPARKAAAKPKARRASAPPKKAAAAAPTDGPRRAVFIDVENTSSESELGRVLDELEIDLSSGATEVTAIGNWRVVGQHLGRSLAQRGANLVHSAPATRVPDWSDLWIAVHAGMWLGRSRPGDRIDVVSHDRAFDAVGDAAARLGVAFRRITYKSTAPSTHAAERTAEPSGERRPRRRRRRGGGRGSASSSSPTTSVRTPAAAAAHEEPHAASGEQLQQVIARLAAADSTRTVTLDALTVALKSAGFQRPPGSPRLVTRLRRMKDIEVLPNGRVRVVGELEAARGSSPAEPLAEPVLEAANGDGEHGAENGVAAEGTSKRRSRRRGGRRRGGRGRKGAATPASPSE